MRLCLNNIARITILVLNLAQSPTPKRIDFLNPISFRITKILVPILVMLVNNKIPIINSGAPIMYYTSISTPTDKKKIGIKNP